MVTLEASLGLPGYVSIILSPEDHQEVGNVSTRTIEVDAGKDYENSILHIARSIMTVREGASAFASGLEPGRHQRLGVARG
jgi:hypothetical protein